MTNPVSGAVEAVARALCTEYGSDPDEWWESWINEARAAISAHLRALAQPGAISEAALAKACTAFWHAYDEEDHLNDTGAMRSGLAAALTQMGAE